MYKKLPFPRWVSVLGVIVMIAAAARAQDVYHDPIFKQALELDSLGKHDRAMKLFEQLAQQPAYASGAYQAMAACAFEHRKAYDEAFALLQRAISADPKDPGNYLNRSAMYQNMGMPERSLDDLRTALPLADSAAMRKSVLMNMGAAYLGMHDGTRALEQFNAALALDSLDQATLLNKSTALEFLGRSEESLALLERLTTLDPKNTVYLNNIGFQLTNMERHAEAVTWFNKSLEIQKDDPYALNNRGYARLRSGDVDGALKDVQRSIKLMPGNAYAYRNLGLIWKEKGEKDKACSAFEEATQRGYTKMFGDDMKKVYESYCH